MSKALLLRLLALLILVNTQRESFAYEPKPLIAGPQAYLQAQFDRDYQNYLDQVENEYKTKSADPEAIRPAALEYLRAVDKVFPDFSKYPHEIDPIVIGKLSAKGSELTKQGAVDPLVLLAYQRVAFKENKDVEQWKTLLQQVEERLPKSGYSPLTKMEIMSRHYVAASRLAGNKSKYPQPTMDALFAAFSEWLKSEQENTAAQRLVWAKSRILRGYFKFNKKHEQEFYGKLARAQVGHPWFQLMIVAEQSWSHAEELKNYLKTDNDHANYHAALKEAATVYEAAWKTYPQFPEPCVQLLLIGRLIPLEQTPREWFDRAIAAQFDYPPTYDQYRMVMRRTAGREFESLFAFGKECAETKRFDTKVPFELTECLVAAEDELGHTLNVYSQPGVYETFEEMLNGADAAPTYCGQPHSDLTHCWIRATHMAVALRAGKSEAVQKHYPVATKSVAHLARALRMYGVLDSVTDVRLRVEATKSGIQTDALSQRWSKLADAREITAARQELQKLRLGKPPAVAGWLDGWDMQLEVAAKFAAGESAEIRFTPEWLLNSGGEEWQLVNERTLKALGGKYLYLPLPPSREAFEIRGQIKVVKEAAQGTQRHGFAVSNDPRLRQQLSFTFDVQKNIYSWVSDDLPFKAPLHEVNELCVRVWPYYNEVFLNGQRVYDHFVPNFEPVCRVMLLAPDKFDPAGNDIQYGNFAIRRLGNPPPQDPAGRIKYLTAELQRQPDVNTTYSRGLAYFSNDEFQPCIDDMNAVLKVHPEHLKPIRMRARSYRHLGKYQAAIDDYEFLRQKMNQDTDLDAERSWLFATCKDDKLRDLKKASTIATRIINAGGSINARLVRVVIHLEKKEYDKAADTLQQLEKNLTRFDATQGLRFKALETALKQKQPYHE